MRKREYCRELHCDKKADVKVKFGPYTVEIIPYCQKHADEKVNDEELNTMWIRPI